MVKPYIYELGVSLERDYNKQQNMSFFKRLFGTDRKQETQPSEDHLPWIEASETPWGLKLLDLRPITQAMLSTSKDPQMATNAISYGGEDGSQIPFSIFY